jgi:hypothetical protein
VLSTSVRAPYQLFRSVLEDPPVVRCERTDVERGVTFVEIGPDETAPFMVPSEKGSMESLQVCGNCRRRQQRAEIVIVRSWLEVRTAIVVAEIGSHESYEASLESGPFIAAHDILRMPVRQVSEPDLLMQR